MKKLQDKVLADLALCVEEAGFEPVLALHHSNAGHISVQRKMDTVAVYGRIVFGFDYPNFTFSIHVDGQPVLSQPPRKGYYNFYMRDDERDKYAHFRGVLIAQLGHMAKKWGVHASP